MVDAPVFINASTFEADIDIESKMEQIFSQAAAAYRPKPKSISSTTPIRSGYLTVDLKSDPNDSVGATINPLTGKMGFIHPSMSARWRDQHIL
jgi:hypothetical protein